MVLWEETANPGCYTDLVDQMHPWKRSLSSQQGPHQGRRTGTIEGKGTSLRLLSRGVHHGCLSSSLGRENMASLAPSLCSRKWGLIPTDPQLQVPLTPLAVLACWTPSSNSSTHTCQSLLGLKGTGMFLARHGFS